MTGDGKNLKIMCITALFAGLATVVVGAFLAVANFADIDAWVTASEGVLGTVFGARSAILANVPSNTANIKSKALVAAVVFCAVVAYLFLGAQQVEVAQICLAIVLLVVALVAFVLATRIVKEQLRK